MWTAVVTYMAWLTLGYYNIWDMSWSNHWCSGVKIRKTTWLTFMEPITIIPWILKYSIFRATQPWMAWLQGALGMRLGEFGSHALPEFSQGKSQGQSRFQQTFFRICTRNHCGIQKNRGWSAWNEIPLNWYRGFVWTHGTPKSQGWLCPICGQKHLSVKSYSWVTW